VPADPQLAAWLGELDAVGRGIRELTDAQSDDRLRWRPGPGQWSVAECVDHLAVTNSAYVAHLAPIIRRARARGRLGPGPFAYGFVGAWWVRSLSANCRKMPAPALLAPAAAVDPGEALDKFQRSQAALAQLLTEADGLDLGQIRAPSVVTRLFRLNLAAWITGIVAHQNRHLAQARRVHLAYPN
jgi:hypothetical protein